jgi:hypothetical protein
MRQRAFKVNKALKQSTLNTHKTMNSAKLTTTSGHSWSTSINGTFDEVKKYFLGNRFAVGSFDEDAPNEGFTQEMVTMLEYTNEESGDTTEAEFNVDMAAGSVRLSIKTL